MVIIVVDGFNLDFVRWSFRWRTGRRVFETASSGHHGRVRKGGDLPELENEGVAIWRDDVLNRSLAFLYVDLALK